MEAILVFDMPTTCTDCPCYDYIHGVCANTHKDCELRIQEKPAWCPARPLPSKMIPEMVMGNKFAEGCVHGWNDCIDAITGETE